MTYTTRKRRRHGGEAAMLAAIGAQLERIADELNGPDAMEVSEEEALAAWGLRIYETEFLDALRRLGVTLT